MTDAIIIICAALAAGGAATFLVRYPMVTGGAWRTHPWGVHVMLFTAALLLLELQPLLFRLIGDWPYRAEMLAALMFALAVAHWHRVWLNERNLQPRPPRIPSQRKADDHV